MKRIALYIYITSAMFFAPNALASFISTPDDFLLNEDFTITVPIRSNATALSMEYDVSGNGWGFLGGVRLLTNAGNTTDLRFFGTITHDEGGVLSVGGGSHPSIKNGVAGDSTNLFAGGVGTTEQVIPHLGTEDIFEFLLTITDVDRSVIGFLSMDANLLLSGRHIDPPVSAVPVPAAIWLFGTALIGLVGFGRRKIT